MKIKKVLKKLEIFKIYFQWKYNIAKARNKNTIFKRNINNKLLYITGRGVNFLWK